MQNSFVWWLHLLFNQHKKQCSVSQLAFKIHASKLLQVVSELAMNVGSLWGLIVFEIINSRCIIHSIHFMYNKKYNLWTKINLHTISSIIAQTSWVKITLGSLITFHVSIYAWNLMFWIDDSTISYCALVIYLIERLGSVYSLN